MDDADKKSEDEAAEPARDAAQEEGAKLREVSEEDLKRILAAHETWLETGGEKGRASRSLPNRPPGGRPPQRQLPRGRPQRRQAKAVWKLQ